MSSILFSNRSNFAFAPGDNVSSSGVYNGIRSKSYTYVIPWHGGSITLYAQDSVNESSIATSSANSAKISVQTTVYARIPELNALKAAAQEVQDGPAFRAALKTALETAASHDKVSISVNKSVTIDEYAGVTVHTGTYTVYNNTLTYPVFDATAKSNLQTTAANVDDIDPAQTFMFNTQQIFDQLPTKDTLNQVAQDVNDGIVKPPVVKGGGYTVTRTGDQSAYVLLGDDQIEIDFNPLDPAAAITGVGDAIASYLTP